MVNNNEEDDMQQDKGEATQDGILMMGPTINANGNIRGNKGCRLIHDCVTLR